jgi:Family of unknown function (DUF5946)
VTADGGESVADEDPASADRAAYDELASYTLTHGDPAFIHQHVVDAFGAQHATEGSKPIGVAFALIGLYLHLERGRSGREVQRAHIRLAQRRREWPILELPASSGDLTIHDVLAVPAGPERDRAIDDWCASVWGAWSGSHERVIALVDEMGESRP